jgi:hypothetical protein
MAGRGDGAMAGRLGAAACQARRVKLSRGREGAAERVATVMVG